MIDLHTHTCCSDGADQPAALFEKALAAGLSFLSVTDHNTVATYRSQAAAGYPGKLIPGVEITCMYQGEVVEVLGYGFDVDAMEAELADHVLTFEEKQQREFELICAAFTKAGASFDRNQVAFDPRTESCRKSFLRHLKTDPANRRLFSCDQSWESSRAFTRMEIYNPESPLYVDEESLYPSVKTAVDMIHRSGGTAFLAHLYIYAHAETFRRQLPDMVKSFGLDGIECAHSAFTQAQIDDLNQFCLDHGLLRSGGQRLPWQPQAGYILGNGVWAVGCSRGICEWMAMDQAGNIGAERYSGG